MKIATTLHLLHKKNFCNYYTPNEFSQLPHYNNTLISLFCINCRSINAHWDHLQELLLNMNKTNFLFDLIGLTEIFHIRDDISYNLTGYHSLQYSTRSDADDGGGGIALYIKDDLSVMTYPFLFRMYSNLFSSKSNAI